MMFAGAVYMPGDEVANCRQFAALLKNEAQALGVEFEFNTTVTKLDQTQASSVFVENHSQPRQFSAVVVCAGMASASLLKPLGLRIPLAAIHGYSLTAAIRQPLDAPRSGLMDERYKVAISRLGQRIRVAGGAELGGSPTHKRDSSVKTLYKVLQDWFPGAAHINGSHASVQLWKGVRPMLPDGPPIVASSGLPGLWLNLGHGASGWALSCGSARVVADLISGKAPQIDTEGLGLQRLIR
jgi:D-amino-acid dehydrogenase